MVTNRPQRPLVLLEVQDVGHIHQQCRGQDIGESEIVFGMGIENEIIETMRGEQNENTQRDKTHPIRVLGGIRWQTNEGHYQKHEESRQPLSIRFVGEKRLEKLRTDIQFTRLITFIEEHRGLKIISHSREGEWITVFAVFDRNIDVGMFHQHVQTDGIVIINSKM